MLGWLRGIVGGGRHGLVSECANDAGDGVPIDLSAFPEGAFDLTDGLPRPRWDRIQAAADALAPRYETHRVWSEVQRQWIEALADALGPAYRIVETRSILLLCARADDPAAAASIARMCERIHAGVQEILGEPDDVSGKLPVFVFDSPQTYYTYIYYYYGDGEYGTSAGICINDGDVHIATIDAPAHLERTLAHEMVHARFSTTGARSAIRSTAASGVTYPQRRLPLWLEEGAAEIISRQVARIGPLLLDEVEIRRQRRWWGRKGLATFWSGESFQRGDRGQSLSYTLAEVLVQNLIATRRRENFRAFVDEAQAADAGGAAARVHLGIGLQEIAETFLGEGECAPLARHASDERD